MHPCVDPRATEPSGSREDAGADGGADLRGLIAVKLKIDKVWRHLFNNKKLFNLIFGF